MSRRTRTLLLSAVALVVLGAVLAVLLLLPPAEDGDTTATTVPDTSVTLVKIGEKVTVSSVKVTTPDETFTVAPDKNGDMVVLGYEDLPQDTYVYESLTEYLREITALRLIADTPEHPEDFGFDAEKRSTTIEVTYSDNSHFSFELGDTSPSGEGCYLRKSGSSAIYLVDQEFAGTVAQPSTTYLSVAPITAPQPESEDEALVVRDITFFGSVRPQPVSFQISTDVLENEQQAQVLSGYYLTEPFFRNCRSDTPYLSPSSYYDFTASGIAKVRPTAADLQRYGFNNPYSAFTISLSIKKTVKNNNIETGETTTDISFKNTFQYTVKLGKETMGGERYAVVYTEDELIPLVYTVDPTTLVWTEAQYDDMADLLMFFHYIDQVESMTITLNNKSTTFELTHYPDEEERDDQMMVTIEGTQYPTDDFRTLYSDLISIMRTGSTNTVPSVEPTMTIQIRSNLSLAKSTWIKLYQQTAGKYAVLHSSGELYTVNAKNVEIFMSRCEKYIRGEKLE